MADLSVTSSKVRPVQVFEQITCAAGATITAGQVVRLDATSGKLVLAQADTAANARAIGIAISDTAKTGNVTTVVRRGVLDVGNALDGLNYGVDVYLSNTAGVLADAAGTTPKIVGRVIPGYGATTPDKLLYVEL